MDEILASIRRVMNEEDAVSDSHPKPGPTVVPPATDDVFLLDSSMMINNSNKPNPSGPNPHMPSPHAPGPHAPSQHAPNQHAPAQHAPAGNASAAAPHDLIAPAAAAAASQSMQDLVRKLASERMSQVSRGGATIEDLVRAEIRPVLKDWLDNHLPGLVERLVRAEIERVVNRVTDI